MGGIGLTSDPELSAAATRLRDDLQAAGDGLEPESFGRLLAPLSKNALLRAFKKVGGDHGAIWIIDPKQEHLVPLFGCGEKARGFLDGKFRQPLGEGLISMAFATGQPICENAIHENPGHSADLDRQLGVRTEAMIAVPLSFAGRQRGIVSCVHLTPSDSPPGGEAFSGEDLSEMEMAAGVIARLLDLSLIEILLGWSD